MQVMFSATGPLKRMLTQGELVLEVPPGTKVAGALQEVVEKLGDQAASILPDEGTLRRGIVVVVNDEMLRRDGADHELHDGDQLTVLMPVAGG